MKKIISLFLSLCVILTVCCAGFGSITVFAAEKIEGSEVTWSFDYQTQTLTFDGKGEIPDYDTYEDEDGKSLIPWGGCDYNTIEFGEEITAIGNYAFRKSVGLVAANIPKTITRIGIGAFSNSLALRSVSIENGTTTIGGYAFSGCTSLSVVELPDGIAKIEDYTFYKCTSLASISLPDSVKEISTGAFNSCTSLEAFAAPESLVKIGDRAFYCCEKLKSVTLPESMDYIGSAAFDSCAKLTEIKIPSGIKKIANATFSGCTGLNKVLIPEGIDEIEDEAFSICTSLKAVRIPVSVKTIGEKAFGYGRRGALVDGFVITGYDSTAAHKYATENNMDFASLGDPLAKSGTIGTSISWTIDEFNELSFTGKGEIPDYSLYEMPIYLNGDVESIVIDNNITKYGAYSFLFDCGMFYVPETVTEIGEKAIGYHFDENGKVVKNDGFVVIGYKGTAAETYATENGFDFQILADEGPCGESATWKYDAETKTVTVSGTGVADLNYDVTVWPSFIANGSLIEKIEINEGITEIANESFAGISNGDGKITFRIPKSVTAVGEYSVGYLLNVYYDENEELQYDYYLNPNCVIEGYANTAAQEYAKKNGIEFVELEPTEEPPVEKDTTFKLSEGAVICTLDSEGKLIKIYDQNATDEKIKADFVIGKDLTVNELEKIATGKVLEVKYGENAVEYILALMGDVNGDGVINSADALAVLLHAVSTKELTGAELAAADLDSNGTVNSADALVILRISVGLDDLSAFYPKEETPDKPTDPDEPNPDKPTDPDTPNPNVPTEQ